MPKKSKRSAPEPKAKNYTILGLFLILIGLIAFGGMIGAAGIGGLLLSKTAYWVFGAGEIILPLIFIAVGIQLLLKRSVSVTVRQAIAGTVGIVSLLAICADARVGFGGIIGSSFLTPFISLFDTFFATLILLFICFGSLTIFFDRTPVIFPHLLRAWQWLRGKRSTEDSFEDEEMYEEEEDDDEETLPLPVPAKAAKALAQKPSDIIQSTKPDVEEFEVAPKRTHNFGTYTPPPLSLLENDRGKANVGDVKANANIIRRTLGNFGIEVEMDEVTIGPTVTRYALKPAEGVKLSRIVNLQNDLALALAAHPLRIEAPIPGKSLVGIEIPNKTKATVGLANLLKDPHFQDSKPLLAAIGRNIAGKPVFTSIAKMPHLLIAGTTGSGKSVTIHAIITSLLYRHGPDDLRFIFVDPKRVELTLYNSIPHLLTPVITDAKKAILSLKWAATEMNRRYDLLESESVRDIESYHKKHAKDFEKSESEVDRLPYIVIVIDELADIMQAYPRELEAAIVRLAQMSRAVGIHLILSTQRPEVNVITGLIKANVPSRIALRVPTGIDSRTILDTTGAEKLLGQGDMLALVGTNQPERLQSAFITEDEVKAVVGYLRNAFKDDIRDSIELTGSVSEGKTIFDSEGSDDDDELYEDARAAVMEAGKASTSYIQRKLKVGYARAARLMDMLEERGIIGPADGAKPREILEQPLENAASDDPTLLS
jgi:S-DNA-T family DNA segregation ATPase FtsK/SpoIIIE